MKKLIPLLLILATTSAFAGEADVLEVKTTKSATGEYRFDVTVRHADTGWDHYANKLDVIGSDGTILGTRVLHHPHVYEQPFTRSLSGAKIPEEADKVTVRSHDSAHGYGGKSISVSLP